MSENDCIMTDSHIYPGKELALFEHASNWKKYYQTLLAPHLTRRVLEVGAGIGGTTRYLCDGTQERWTCLEPDPHLCETISLAIKQNRLPACCASVHGSLGDIPDNDNYSTVLYIDVLEHIEEDRNELKMAAEHIAPDGSLIVLAPAHQWLFSALDESVGHFRRYSKQSLANIGPDGMVLAELRYLDSIGMFASLANRLMLHQSIPSKRQIAIWDSLMVPVSNLLDPLLFYSVGKSVLAIWKKEP